jgi:PrtD family type I secretion system ABC transporter
MAAPSIIRQAISQSRGAFLVVAAFSLLINILVLASPLYSMQIFDRVLSSRSVDTLLLLTVIVIIAIAAMSEVETLRSQVLARVGRWVEHKSGPVVLAAAIDDSIQTRTSSSAEALRDLGNIKNFLSSNSVTAIFDAPWAPVFVLVMYAMHPLFGLLALLSAATLLGLTVLTDQSARAPMGKASAAAFKLSHQSELLLRNGDALRGMGMQAGVIERWQKRNQAVLDMTMTAIDRGGIISGISKFVRLVAQLSVMGLGAYLVIHQEISGGVMIAASILLGRVLAPVELVIGGWRSFISARLSYRRLEQLLRRTPPAEDAMKLPTPTGRVAVERLTFVPPGAGKATLKGISLTLDPGEILAIIGPTAAGKSTLSRLLTGVWRPTGGHVRMDGADLENWHRSGQAKDYLGYLPQDIQLLDGSIRENIARVNDAAPEDVVRAAKLAGVHEMILQLPQGYETEIGDGGTTLSGGQKQRIALARAVFGNPRFVVLDEPNANLDAEGEQQLIKTLKQLKFNGCTTIVITHRTNLVTQADKVMVMHDGLPQHFGPTAEVLQKLRNPMTTVPLKPAAAFKPADKMTVSA